MAATIRHRLENKRIVPFGVRDALRGGTRLRLRLPVSPERPFVEQCSVRRVPVGAAVLAQGVAENGSQSCGSDSKQNL